MKCSVCGASSTPESEKHWREVTVTVSAVPPRVAKTRRIKDVLCPLCADDADQTINNEEKTDGERH